MSDIQTAEPTDRAAAAREALAAKRAAAKGETERPFVMATEDEINRKVAEGVQAALRAKELKEIADRAEAEAAQEQARLEAEMQMRGGAVSVRVLPLGHLKISDGSFGFSNDRFGHYARGDTFRCPRTSAQDYEAKGWVEITSVS